MPKLGNHYVALGSLALPLLPAWARWMLPGHSFWLSAAVGAFLHAGALVLLARWHPSSGDVGDQSYIYFELPA